MSKQPEQKAQGTRPSPAGTPPRPPAKRPTGATPVGATRPATSNVRVGPAKPLVGAKPASKGLGPVDLAIITVGIAIVGALIWFGLGGLNPSNGNSGVVPGNASTPGTSGTSGSNGSLIPADYNATPVALGRPAPDFSLPASDGKTYSLSQFKGKVVLVEFFAPWCPHCQDDAPIVNKVYTDYKEKNVQVLAVSASPYGKDYSETNNNAITIADVAWFHDNFQVPFPILFDPKVGTASSYGITRFPTLYVVNTDGTLATLIENPPTYEKIAAALDKVLKKAAAPAPASNAPLAPPQD